MVTDMELLQGNYARERDFARAATRAFDPLEALVQMVPDGTPVTVEEQEGHLTLELRGGTARLLVPTHRMLEALALIEHLCADRVA